MKNFPGGKELVMKLYHCTDWKSEIDIAFTNQNEIIVHLSEHMGILGSIRLIEVKMQYLT